MRQQIGILESKAEATATEFFSLRRLQGSVVLRAVVTVEEECSLRGLDAAEQAEAGDKG
jgi:hypothetical protein